MELLSVLDDNGFTLHGKAAERAVILFNAGEELTSTKECTTFGWKSLGRRMCRTLSQSFSKFSQRAEADREVNLSHVTAGLGIKRDREFVSPALLGGFE